MSFTHKQDLIGQFAQHKVAANLLMIIMLMSGGWALFKLHTQFFPTFGIDYISVTVPWRGASAEDVEEAVINVMEDRFRTLDSVKSITSTAKEGIGFIFIELDEGTDKGPALDQVQQEIKLIRNLPESAEEPQISLLEHSEMIGRAVLSGPVTLEELRPLAKLYEDALLAAGINQVEIYGLPEEEIAIQIPQANLHELGLSIEQAAQLITAGSQDLPAGSIGKDEATRQLRATEKRRNALEFAQLPLLTDAQGRLITVGDVATVERRERPGSILMWHNGNPAVELVLQRKKDQDSLKMAGIMRDWHAEAAAKLPDNLHLQLYDEQWKPLQERISMLLKNGISGLLLIIVILYIFLNGRVAFWVTVGIPTSFMATLAVLYAMGGTINMISLFAMIMALGIIVDDAIVVGEDALAHYQMGEPALQASEGGARRMFWPVMSSSMTTIAAFLPLMLIGDYIGDILFAIPLVVICVILASLVESFLVLPGHLRHTFVKIEKDQTPAWRQKFVAGFDRFRNGPFRRFVETAINARWITLSLVLGAMILAIGLLGGGKVKFTFFPTPEVPVIVGNVGFVAGTPVEDIDAFLAHAEEKLWETDASLGPGLVTIAITRRGLNVNPGNNFTRTGEQFALFQVELLQPDEREIRNEQFIAEWKSRVEQVPGLEQFGLFSPTAGPPGRDLQIRLAGSDAHALKRAATALTAKLVTIPGVYGIDDNTPWGQEQLIYSLTPEAESLGFSVTSLGQQLRNNFDGRLTQIFQDNGDEVEVRVMLPDAERNSLFGFDALPLQTPNGGSTVLGNMVNFESQRGLERLRHRDGKLAITVSADVNVNAANTEEVRKAVAETLFPEIEAEFNVEASYVGAAQDQAETLAEMTVGLVYAVVLIYLVLAWVFGSWGWPLMVMAIIPFGLVGALAGHYVLGIDMTMLSLFGLFGLSGIVVNDSIILVVFYKELRQRGRSIREALLDASVARLRAVILTSATTIAGLTPLMFETSLQASFLIPMAASITFGLAFATILVLVLVPCLLSIYEDLMEWLGLQSATHDESPVGSAIETDLAQ
ncbi:MAG: efflux RND transporter permease subunit [Gammaproteobacteria bacterium]|nr:efflux RND transporter permease subunit [Gammaproteobacteria bacterium]